MPVLPLFKRLIGFRIAAHCPVLFVQFGASPERLQSQLFYCLWAGCHGALEWSGMPIGRLSGEKPEPLGRDDFERIRTTLRQSAMSSIYVPRSDVDLLVREIAWLKRRMRRLEHAVEPVVEALRQDPAKRQ